MGERMPERIVAWEVTGSSHVLGAWHGPDFKPAMDCGAPYIRADLHDAALARLAAAEAERDEARRRRDAWKDRAKDYEAMRAALAEKAKDAPPVNFSRLMLIAMLNEARAENEELRAALASGGT